MEIHANLCHLIWHCNDKCMAARGVKSCHCKAYSAQHGVPSLQWETIAEELGTGRTAAACLARYQRCHNPELLSSKWTPEEATRLADAIAKHGTHNWQAGHLRVPAFPLSQSEAGATNNTPCVI